MQKERKVVQKKKLIDMTVMKLVVVLLLKDMFHQKYVALDIKCIRYSQPFLNKVSKELKLFNNYQKNYG